MSQKVVVASFLILSLLGSLLIILSASLHFGKALWHASEEASLQNVLTWTLKLSIFERSLIYSVGFICTFFLFIDTVFVIFILCTVKLENLPSYLTSTYKKYNSDIECPLPVFTTPPLLTSTPKTPATVKNEQKDTAKSKKKVNKALFHTEDEKKSSVSRVQERKKVSLKREQETLKEVVLKIEEEDKSIVLSDSEYDDTGFIKFEIEDEKQEVAAKMDLYPVTIWMDVQFDKDGKEVIAGMNSQAVTVRTDMQVDDKMEEALVQEEDGKEQIIAQEEEEEEDKKEIDQDAVEKFPVGKYWSRLETIAEVHNIPDDLKPTHFIKLPNNARETGLTEEMQKILGEEIDEIVNKSFDDEASPTKKYVFIKPIDELADQSFEAILYTGNLEVAC